MSETIINRRAPMAAAPLRYRSDGAVDWGQMWDSYCELALSGGPPHRSEMLYAQENADIASRGYEWTCIEISRGISEVSGLKCRPDAPGWLCVLCPSAAMATWLAEAITSENVQARAYGKNLYVPLGDYFTVRGEIKNVITAVAKTTHYWQEHLPREVKLALGLQAAAATLLAWFRW